MLPGWSCICDLTILLRVSTLHWYRYVMQRESPSSLYKNTEKLLRGSSAVVGEADAGLKSLTQ